MSNSSDKTESDSASVMSSEESIRKLELFTIWYINNKRMPEEIADYDKKEARDLVQEFLKDEIEKADNPPRNIEQKVVALGEWMLRGGECPKDFSFNEKYVLYHLIQKFCRRELSTIAGFSDYLDDFDGEEGGPPPFLQKSSGNSERTNQADKNV